MPEMIELKGELDKLLGTLSGVLAARTVLNADNEIIEIHILSDLTKSPKQLVRDIQSAIMAAFGLDIDYKLISVAQVNSNIAVPSIPSEPRLAIRKIMISLDSNSLETTVVLAQGDKSFEGSSRGPLSSRNRIHSAANACLAAIKSYLGPACNIMLLDLQRSTIGGVECFIVAVSFDDPNSESILFGIAQIHSPEFEVQAVVKAVLSSINRPISRPKKR